MPVTNWNTTIIDGKSYLVVDVAKFRIPLEWDPSSNMFVAVCAPDGGLGNFPALVKGDNGDTPQLDNTINFTPLEYADPTPEFASWTETSPNVYKLNLGLKRGQKGNDGNTVLTPSDYGTAVAGRLLRVKSDLSGFELIAPPVGGRFLPATMNNIPTGNPSFTVCAVPCSAQPFDWWPEVEGQGVITGTGADVRVDLMARLSTAGISNGETAGPIVGRAFGGTGVNPPTHVLSSAPPAGSSAAYDKVLAGNTAVVYLRTERQAGGNTYSGVATDFIFKVKAAPIP